MRRTAALLALFVLAPAASAKQPPTTVKRFVNGDVEAAYSTLSFAPGWKRVVRKDLATPQKGRAQRRRSLVYFAQLSDFQLADEESPARVESLDQPDTPFTAAWRPQEALEPFTIDAAVRQVNAFVRSPLRAAKRKRAKLKMVITTGDNADNQQVNEITWVRQLLEGGTVNPNSGVESDAVCPAGPIEKGESANYTGVQDHDDVADTGRFYDPDEPSGIYAGFPTWPGLLDRAQQPFTAKGLRVPSYVSLGNHDGNVQGNVWANATFNDVATGCAKPLTFAGVEPAQLITALNNSFAVPPDPERRFVRQPEHREIMGAGRQADAHGLGLVDPAEAQASAGAAAYYTFKRGPVRFIAMNTLAEGSQINPEGNLDDPQFRWIEAQLQRADERGELVILFGHHPIRSLDNDTEDENAPSCAESANDPGCDADPRASTPLHLGTDLQALLLEHPSVIALVSGHTHEHKIAPIEGEDGRGFWAIETSSEVDWPIQSRLLEVMDNRDGTLSIFGTIIDHGAPPATPASGTAASAFGPTILASIARELSFNDPQAGGTTGIGEPKDRNVELLIDDPRS